MFQFDFGPNWYLDSHPGVAGHAETGSSLGTAEWKMWLPLVVHSEDLNQLDEDWKKRASLATWNIKRKMSHYN